MKLRHGLIPLLVFLTAATASAAPGDADTGFSGDPCICRTTDFSSDSDSAEDVIVQPNGKVVAVGYAARTDSFISDFGLARYRLNGNLDTGFGELGNGKVTTTLTDGGDGARGVALQPNGKIVVVGEADSGAYTDFGIARYNRDGTLDTSFSGDGKKTSHLSDSHDNAYAVAPAPHGKVVVAGVISDDDNSDGDTGDDFAVVRYRRKGGLDKTFSDDGIKSIDFGGDFDEGRDVVLQPDGKILVTGRGQGKVDETDFAVARLRTNGRLDKTFSKDGKQTADSGLLGADIPEAVKLQSTGRIVLAGTVHATEGDTSDENFGAARFKAGGALDKDFGTDGWSFVSETDDDSPNDMAIQKDDKIIVVGSDDFFNLNFMIVRIKKNGDPDPQWGDEGIVIHDLGDASAAYGVAITPDDKVVAAGERYGGSVLESDFVLARYKTGL
jgi:uncharacterized delta-60 repeat protein